MKLQVNDLKYYSLLIVIICMISGCVFLKRGLVSFDYQTDFVKITDNLYCSKYELPNGAIVGAVNTMRKSINPPTTYIKIWDRYNAKTHKFLYEHFSDGYEYCTYLHEFLRFHYPLVEITKNEADSLCTLFKLYEMTVRACRASGKKENQIDADSLLKLITPKNKYRLPTEAEWEKIALHKALRWDTLYGLRIKKFKQLYDVNTAEMVAYRYLLYNRLKFNLNEYYEMLDDSINGGAWDVVIKSKNRAGVHGLIGNVAEMVQEDGIAKGGSWHHSIIKATIQDTIQYHRPERWLGFRCVCEELDR